MVGSNADMAAGWTALFFGDFALDAGAACRKSQRRNMLLFCASEREKKKKVDFEWEELTRQMSRWK